MEINEIFFSQYFGCGKIPCGTLSLLCFLGVPVEQNVVVNRLDNLAH